MTKWRPGRSDSTMRSASMEKVETICKLIYNPYKKRIDYKKKIKKGNNYNNKHKQRKTEYRSDDNDTKWFGIKMREKPKAFRLYIQNPNGIDINDGLLPFRLLLDNMKRYRIDALLLPEANINRNNVRIIEKLKESTQLHCDNGRFLSTNTPGFPIKSHHQPGGVATILNGKYMSRYAQSDYDEAGRWITSKYYGKDKMLKIYNLYRVCENSSKHKIGDSTSWVQQQQYFRTKGKDINPRKKVVNDLINEIANDLNSGNELIIAGDFNEPLGEVKNGLHEKLQELGLVNLISEKLLDKEIPRTYRRGSSCIDHIYMTNTVLDSVKAYGIAPFDYFINSDHRGLYVDFKIEKILNAEQILLHPASLRRLKLSSVNAVKKYQEIINKELNMHQYLKKVEKVKKSLQCKGKTKQTIRELNKLDSEITQSLLYAEKKCAKIHMNCKYDWSPQLKDALRSYTWAKNNIKRIKREGVKDNEEQYQESISKAYEERRKWKKRVNEVKKTAEQLRENHLQERAKYEADLKNSNAVTELKQIKLHEKQRKEARRIRLSIKGSFRSSLNTIEIPALDQYTEFEQANPNFNHKDIKTIWKKIGDTDNGTKINNWEIIESKTETERFILQWMQLYQGQAKETPLSSGSRDINLQDEHFRDRLLKGDITKSECSNIEIYEFLRALRRKRAVPQLKFEYTYNDFTKMIKKMKEKTSSSPSGRHIGHYKALLQMENTDMLEIIYDILNLSMTFGIVLERFYKVATTLLEKDSGQPKIHRLRPICIVETELNCIAKSQWSKKLMRHVDTFKLLTEDQYGGRAGRQAQSAVLNKILYYNIQNQIAEEAIFIDKDGRSCFDRLLPKLVSLENEKVGLPKIASRYMEETLDNQEIHFKTGHGLTSEYVKKTDEIPKYGAGQGIGWSGQACNATLNIIANAMTETCSGMKFVNPRRTVEIVTFGDYFVDDTELGTNIMGKPLYRSLIDQARFNDQKHTYYWYISGGRNAVEKGLWYHLKHKFVEGRAVPMSSSELSDSVLQTKPSFHEDEVEVPLYDVSKSHKTLGCWVSPTMNQTKQKKVLIEMCKKWSQRMTTSYLTAYEIRRAYESVLLKQIDYRLVTACFTYEDCEDIMKHYIPKLCHSFHIHKHMDRNLVFGAKKYGGLGIMHLYDVMGTQKMKFFMQHLRKNDKTGKLLRMSMEYTQLQMGISTPFYKTRYSDWKDIVTPTWVTNLWEYWEKADVKVDISDFWLHKKSREHDRFIMDLLIPHVKDKKKHFQLNTCRMALNVITTADITTLNGSELLPGVVDGLLQRKSKYKWPNQQVPKRWWKLWSTYIKTIIAPYIRSHKLGQQISLPHQDSIWKMSSCKTFVSDGKRIYKKRDTGKYRSRYAVYMKCDMKSRIHTPDKVDVILRKNNLSIISRYNKRVNLPRIEVTTPVIPSQVIKRTSQKEKMVDNYKFLRKHQITSIKKLEKLKRAYKKSKICAASDGSALPNDRSSFAYCLVRRKDEKKLYSVHSPVYCDPEYSSSDRAEIMAILGVVSQIYNIYKENGPPKKKQPIVLYTDSESSIKIIANEIYHSPKNVMKANIDVALEIQHLIKEMPKGLIVFKHVQSHLDKKIKYNKLPMANRLNIDMDRLAARQYKCNINEHNRIFPHLRQACVSIICNGHRLNHNMEYEYRRMRQDQGAERSALIKWKIKKEHARKIDWKALDASLSKWRKAQYGGAVKAINRLWDTAERKLQWKQSSSGMCPLCHTHIETCDHVLRCKEQNITAARLHLLNELEQKLKKIKTHPLLLAWILIGMKQWIKGYKISRPDRTSNNKKLRKAIREQKKLGYNNLFRGILSTKWNKTQLSYGKGTGKYDSGNVTHWSNKASRYLMEYTIDCWRIRCDIVHKNKIGTAEEVVRELAKQLCQKIKGDPGLVLPSDFSSIIRSDKFFSGTPITNILAWKRRTEIAINWNRKKNRQMGTNVEEMFRNYSYKMPT